MSTRLKQVAGYENKNELIQEAIHALKIVVKVVVI